ncbi:uncharacterized protein LOC111704142 isoform X2 [Eurytemora carolleeae]|uniref:uncharacterized protein LOC111704142 isoform X2 n=1 Tax=Eurytemora carolleeae TaxID=1294199 RepID=UPI000C76F465|nr:uncharacterized protein LOC111704142 isoform X2 [Eurytemora carolleeae]|eukprot:XP_023332051.1 uncharacterized protein LOC111704142 isoform X2 [Eurytemora affinis]
MCQTPSNLEYFLRERAFERKRRLETWLEKSFINPRLRHIEKKAERAKQRCLRDTNPAKSGISFQEHDLPRYFSSDSFEFIAPEKIKFQEHWESRDTKFSISENATNINHIIPYQVHTNVLHVLLCSTDVLTVDTFYLVRVTTSVSALDQKNFSYCSIETTLVFFDDCVNTTNNRSRFFSVSSSNVCGSEEDECWEYLNDEEYQSDNSEEWVYEEYAIEEVVPDFPCKKLQSPWSSSEIRFPLPRECMESSSRLEALFQDLLDKESSILMDIQSDEDIPIEKRKELKPSILKSNCPKDKQGRLHGQGEIFYSNGSKFTGRLFHGCREGVGVLEYLNGDMITGDYKRDKLNGWCEFVSENTGLWRQNYFRDGYECGYYRTIYTDSTVEFGKIGSNSVWRFLEGGAAMFGTINKNGKFEGHDILYLYPGYRICINGEYTEGKLKSGYECILKKLKINNGMPRPEIWKLRNTRTLSYEFPGTHCPAKNLHLRDIIDIINVYVDQSNIPYAGEGLFAKKFIKKGELVVLFNGARKRKISREHQFEEFSDYCIRVDSVLSLDIPECFVPVNNYSATLAHKACHSFSPNAGFYILEHPRFGKIMSIKALEDLRRGDEILVSYNYRMEGAPEWYSELWYNHLRCLGWPESFVTKFGLAASGCSNIFKSVESKLKYVC